MTAAPALSRRVDVEIAMDIPDPLDRMALWARAMGDIPLGGTDRTLLSALPLSGGDIVACVREAGGRGAAALMAAGRRRVEARRLIG